MIKLYSTFINLFGVSMSYSAQVAVTGSHDYKDEQKFFERTIVVTEDTLGQMFDSMVNAASEIRAEIIAYIVENFDVDYSMSDDYWYKSVAYPNLTNPHASEEFNYGAGGSLSNVDELVISVVHYRHMEIQRFFGMELLHLRDSYYSHYVKGIEAENRFTDIYDAPLEEATNYGFTGTQLDAVLNEMGPDYDHFLKDYGNYIGVLRSARARRNKASQEAKLREAKQKEKFENRNHAKVSLKQRLVSIFS
jgi:hypothetical protein